MATEDTIRDYYDAILQVENPSESEIAELAGQVDDGVITLDDVRDTLIASAEDDVYAVVRMYQASFGRVPDDGGLDYWTDQLREGNISLTDLATAFTSSDEFADRYGAIDQITEAYVTELYQNVLGREPDQAGLDYWTSQDQLSPAQMLFSFSESTEFEGRSDDAIHDYLDGAAQGTQDYEGGLFEDGNDDGTPDDDGDTGGNPGGGSTNHAPVIGFASGDADRTIEENKTYVADVDANDPDGDTVTFTIAGGADASLFTIDSSSGDLEFKDAPDFENPNDDDTDKTYDVTIKASDGALSDTKDVSVTVTDVDPADLTTIGSGFDTDNGTNIYEKVAVTSGADTIYVVDNAHLYDSILEGLGGADTVHFNEGGGEYNLSTLSEISGFDNVVGDTLELGGADVSLVGESATLNAFANIDGNGGTLLVDDDIDTIGNFDDDKTTLSNFGSIMMSDANLDPTTTIALDIEELPSSSIDFIDPDGVFADTLAISTGGGGSQIVDLRTENIALNDFGAGGSTDTIGLSASGTLLIDGCGVGNFFNSAGIALSAAGTGSDFAIASEGDLDLNDFAEVTGFGRLESAGTGIGIAIANDDTGREIVGDAGSNDIDGGLGDDTIDGGNGADDITGGGGTNQYTASAGADTYTGTADEDAILTYGAVSQSAFGGTVDTMDISDTPNSIKVVFDFVARPDDSTTSTGEDIFRTYNDADDIEPAEGDDDFFAATDEDILTNGGDASDGNHAFVIYQTNETDFSVYFDANNDGALNSGEDMQINLTGLSSIDAFPDVTLAFGSP